MGNFDAKPGESIPRTVLGCGTGNGHGFLGCLPTEMGTVGVPRPPVLPDGQPLPARPKGEPRLRQRRNPRPRPGPIRRAGDP